MGERAESSCWWIDLGLVAALHCIELDVGQRVAGDWEWIDFGLGARYQRCAGLNVGGWSCIVCWGGGLGVRSSSSSGVSGVEPRGALAGRGLVFVGCPLVS